MFYVPFDSPLSIFPKGTMFRLCDRAEKEEIFIIFIFFMFSFDSSFFSLFHPCNLGEIPHTGDSNIGRCDDNTINE